MFLRRTLLLGIALFGTLGLLHAQAPGPDSIDGNRVRQARQQRAQSRPADHKPPVRLKPLTDTTADEKYKGEEGGLYGGGKNEPPDKHRQAALAQARLIQPLDAQGKPARDGKIVLISVGMSNTTQEFSQFVRLASDDPARSPQVVIVDGAQGGMDAQSWAEPNRARDPWEVLEQRLKRAGVTPQQVQVAWIKQARRNPAALGEFPRHAQEMKGHLVVILHKLRDSFPNLRLAYLSSRIYAGYARTPLNPEPFAYESAFVVRWLIQDQIKGNPALNFDPGKGVVKSPLLLWGPYLWAEGDKGRKTDGLVWKPEDFAQDGTHPGPSGRRKVAELLLKFLKSDPSAREWFTRRDR